MVARTFSFLGDRKFPAGQSAISWEISTPSVEGAESGARDESMMGNGRRFEARKGRLFPRPLPIIGV
jgi:hypothetical protein